MASEIITNSIVPSNGNGTIFQTPAVSTAFDTSAPFSASTGDANGSNTTAGNISLHPGNAAGDSSTVAGSLSFQAGQAIDGTPGSASLLGGAVTGTTAQDAGNATIAGGNVTSGASSGDGGNVLIAGGSAAGSGKQGYITLSALYANLPLGTTDPSAPEGSIYYNTSSHKFRLYNGSSWVDLN